MQIFVIGMACVYPDAANIQQFWESILTKRRSFRPFPKQRLPLTEYGSASNQDKDKTTVKRGAFIDGYAFDWKTHRIPKTTYVTTDLTHWLALDTALAALKDSGVNLDAVGRERVSVIIGNSLTGEISRANLLRLRWPYVQQAIANAAQHLNISKPDLATLIAHTEINFKHNFPIPTEDSLAGALSNVIAGRICNFLDLNGGGYTVDGACASSLIAVANACQALESGQLDLAIAGGVDISLDPLELVGFSRTGALSNGPMRVYDQSPTGFLPGEGCGMLVLAHDKIVQQHNLKPWARIAGWGISSDGAGGITAPKASAQALAISRCYQRSDFNPTNLDFIEGHGTGTPVGDHQELLGFIHATGNEETPDTRNIGVTSIKTLIGHTKAAAGIAGLIKAILGVNQRVLPPLAGLNQPANIFTTPHAKIYPITTGKALNPTTTMRAGVSGAGFGGINCHIAITNHNLPKRQLTNLNPALLLASSQHAEVFICSAETITDLIKKINELKDLATGMADGELADLAADTALKDTAAPIRAAIIATNVEQLHEKLQLAAQTLATDHIQPPQLPPGVIFGTAQPYPRIGYLYPGQGSQFIGMGCKLIPKYGWAATRRKRWDGQFSFLGPNGLYGFIDLPLERALGTTIRTSWKHTLRDTKISQPAVAVTSLQWTQWLNQIGITPNAVIGHSLGEIPALVASHLLSETEAMDLVRIRANACSATEVPPGGMLALKCNLDQAQELLDNISDYAIVANDNAPDQVVVSGDPAAISAIAELARQHNIGNINLNVSKAFHSKHMANAAQALAQTARMRGEERTANTAFFSSVYGKQITTPLDPFAYLAQQITAPVRFREALLAMASACDILVEIGPGSVLTGLARRTLGSTIPICALEPDMADSDIEYCTSIGQLYVTGAPIAWDTFYAARYIRPFIPANKRNFITNPCANVDPIDPELLATPVQHVRSDPVPQPADHQVAASTKITANTTIIDVIRQLIAAKTGYDLETISPDAQLARDLNLDSIKVAEIQAELRNRHIELPNTIALATTTISALAQAATQHPVTATPQEPQVLATTNGPKTVKLPKDLPVSGYLHTWHPVNLLASTIIPDDVIILTIPEQIDLATDVIHSLNLLTAQVTLDTDGQTQWPNITHIAATRIIVLTGNHNLVTANSNLIANLGSKLNLIIHNHNQQSVIQNSDFSALSVIFLSLPNTAPVFGLAQSLSLEQPTLPILAATITSTTNIKTLLTSEIKPGVQLLQAQDAANNNYVRMAIDYWNPPTSLASPIPLAPDDLIVCSGGAKGITAACIYALLRKTGARAILLGTSPEHTTNSEITKNLQRLTETGISAIYLQCNVADLTSVQHAIQRGQQQLGANTIAGIIHGAGVNIPALITQINPAAITKEYTTKVEGLNNLLSVTDPKHLKLCVALGSVIGSIGMHGNGGYALANEAMANTLKNFKTQYPKVQVSCIAYSVWAEIGLGAKLNVLDRLEQQNIAAIPVTSGVEWFLTCCSQPDLPIPLIVATPMHGLATWRQARATQDAKFDPPLHACLAYEPGLILLARSVVNLQRDNWLLDHTLRGTTLYPTVQALGLMAAAAKTLAQQNTVTTISKLRITNPIVIAQHGDTTIEVDVRRPVANQDSWLGHIGISGSAFQDPAFSAQLKLGAAKPYTGRLSPSITTNWHKISPEIGLGLYHTLLFHGPTFQRIETVDYLDLTDAVQRRGQFGLRRKATENSAAIPDPLFLDAMLQVVQILIPKDQCLPVGVETIHFYPEAWQDGLAQVEAEILAKTTAGYLTQVRAWDAKSQALIVSYEGYQVNIVTQHPKRWDASAMLDPIAHDRLALKQWLTQYPELVNFNVVLGQIFEQDQIARRQTAANQIAAQLHISPDTLTWNFEGQPMLVGLPWQGVSIAHDVHRLLSVIGTGRIGCDLQHIGSNSNRAWGKLLPKSRLRLWHDLKACGIDRDQAGGIVWAIYEALIKAGAPDLEVKLEQADKHTPRFSFNRPGLIAAGILDLVPIGPTAIAIVQLTTDGASTFISHYQRDIIMTFKEVLPPLKSPTISIFCNWMGMLREEAMGDIRAELAQAFGKDRKGIVTNGTQLHILNPVDFVTPLRAWVWLQQVLVNQPSTFELGFQWSTLGSDNEPAQIVAAGTQRLTWVGINANDQIQIENFPNFFAEFIIKRTPALGLGPFTPPLGHLPPPQKETPLWRNYDKNQQDSPHMHGSASLNLNTDSTYSNFVGNIYFAHIVSLVERTCHKALLQLGATQESGFFATNLQLDHLGEAMPGNILAVTVQLTIITANSCTFELSLTNQSHGNTKIAAGRVRYQLFDATTEPMHIQPIPAWMYPSTTSGSQV